MDTACRCPDVAFPHGHCQPAALSDGSLGPCVLQGRKLFTNPYKPSWPLRQVRATGCLGCLGSESLYAKADFAVYQDYAMASKGTSGSSYEETFAKGAQIKMCGGDKGGQAEPQSGRRQGAVGQCLTSATCPGTALWPSPVCEEPQERRESLHRCPTAAVP